MSISVVAYLIFGYQLFVISFSVRIYKWLHFIICIYVFYLLVFGGFFYLFVCFLLFALFHFALVFFYVRFCLFVRVCLFVCFFIHFVCLFIFVFVLFCFCFVLFYFYFILLRIFFSFAFMIYFILCFGSILDKLTLSYNYTTSLEYVTVMDYDSYFVQTII